MAINFPSSLDSLTNPTANDQVATVDHALQHANANDAIEALEAKVGANSSAVTTSHDYKLSGVTGTDKAASLTGTEALTNKTLTSPTLTTPKFADGGSINDSNSNELVKFAVTASAVNEVNVTNNTTGNAPIVGVSGNDTDIDLSLKGKGTGKVKFGTANIKLPNADGSAGQFLKTDGAGTLSFVSPTTSVDAIIDIAVLSSTIKSFSSDTAGTRIGGTSAVLAVEQTDYPLQKRTFTTDWASASDSSSFVRLGAYIYALYYDASNNYRLYRYDRTDLSTGGTLMTISGQAFSTTGGANVKMTSDGTFFYFNYKGGTSANDYVVSKFSLSGTTLTYVSDITCGSSAGSVTAFMVDSSINIYAVQDSDKTIRKFNSGGTLQYTTPAFAFPASILAYISGTFYGYMNTPARFVKIILT